MFLIEMKVRSLRALYWRCEDGFAVSRGSGDSEHRYFALILIELEKAWGATIVNFSL